jgi:hypothetical protein
VNHENKIEVSKTQGVWQVKRDEKHVDWYDSFAEAKKALVA